MSETDFSRFKAESVARYANDQITANRWLVQGAFEQALSEFERLLPMGLSTPLHYIFNIVEPANQASVGSLWFGLTERQGGREAFVYDVQINEAFRRRGYARRAFQAIEVIAKELGVRGIGLHVFGFNASAQALYNSLGYTVTSLNMHRVLLHASD